MTEGKTSNMVDDYPLNCIDETGDGHSGWFAISNPRQCNDFCYWSIEKKEKKKINTTADEVDGIVSDNDDDYDGRYIYTARNTADPHRTTAIYGIEEAISYWVCIYGSADDKFLVSQVNHNEERWVDTWHNHLDKKSIKTINADDSKSNRNNDDYGSSNNKINNNVPFPYLRCQKGAGEYLRTYSGDAVQSSVFWQSWIILCSLIIIGQVTMLVVRCINKKRKWKPRYDPLTTTTPVSINIEPGLKTEEISDDLQIDEMTEAVDSYGDFLMSSNGSKTVLIEQESMEIDDPIASNTLGGRDFLNPSSYSYVSSHRCKYWAPYLSHHALNLLRLLSMFVLNAFLLVTIAFASLSLMETKYHVELSETMKKLTPECTNPYLACPKGNQIIDNPSSTYISADEKTSSFVRSESTISPGISKPFSYIIGSDSQLFWFNGEFAEMGLKNIPSSCTEKDSCGSCTTKHGYNTNLRLKRAWEILMTGNSDGMSNKTTSSVNLPIPNTLIMNGDLTAYFHPYQKDAYTSIYDDIDGLEHYFPGLGNHDIEHGGGGMYGGDEWIGPANCNAEHAIGYFKSGFCGKIPNFHTERIVRYDPSSLSYSWEEGRYHFVMLHYYPTFELASLSFRSSIIWLEHDLQLAHDAGLSTILYVHAAQGLSPSVEDAILGKGVKAIFAGHTHRCLHRRCDGIYPLNEDQVNKLDFLNTTVDKCIPAAYDVCEALE